MRSIREIRSLTGLRGVAAMYAVFYHYFPVETTTNVVKRALSHGYLAVDLFFVLSGFVMALNYQHLFTAGSPRTAYLTFLGRRIARIYPLYIVTALIAFGLVIFRALPYPSGPLSIPLLANVLMVQAWGIASSFDSPAWSISAEWAAYVVFPLVLIPAMFRGTRIAWLCAGVCIATLATLCALPPALLPDYLVRNPLNMNGYWLGLPVLRCIPEFTLGILAFRLAGTSAGKRLSTSKWIGPGLCGAFVLLVAVPAKADLAVVLLLPLLVVSLASDTHIASRLLASPVAERIGKLSFSIYLTHKLLFGLLNWLYVRGYATGLPHARGIAGLICLALTAVLASAAYRFIEVPGRSLLRDWCNRALNGGPSRPKSAALGVDRSYERPYAVNDL